MKTESKHLETLAVHAGQTPDATTGAISVPVYFTSTYVQEGPGEHKGFEYSRTHNPTRFALEANLAALEGGTHGLCFASGLAATATLLHLLSAGDHVVAGDDLYGGTYRLFERVMRKQGLDFSYVDPTRPEAFETALRLQRSREQPYELGRSLLAYGRTLRRSRRRRSRGYACAAASGAASCTVRDRSRRRWT